MQLTPYFVLQIFLLLVIMQGGKKKYRKLLPQPETAELTFADKVGERICNNKPSICGLSQIS